MKNEITMEYPHFHGFTEIIESSEYLASLKLTIDTKEHIYLIDHIFGEQCFVPATMIIEIFLEAALWYERSIEPQTDLLPLMLQNLNIARAIAIDPGDSLQITVNILAADRDKDMSRQKIEIVSYRYAKNGKIIGMRLNASCEVFLSAESMKTTPMTIPAAIKFNHYSVEPEKWYKYLFPSLLHCFHGSTGNVSISQDGNWLMGIYNCMNKESSFIKGKQSEFVSSPLGNDTCLQYAVFLARYVARVGRLPVGGKKIILSRCYPKDGDVRVVVKLLNINEETALFDILSFVDENKPIFYAEEFLVRTSPFQSPLDRKELSEFFNRNSIIKDSGKTV